MTQFTPFAPGDALQAKFLAALSQGETALRADAYTLGVGGAHLAHCQRNEYGFPLWAGLKNSHAAGRYQFEPSTWARIASKYHLNFSNPADQDAGAWYLAQADYFARTRLQLVEAIRGGNFMSVQKFLFGTWPSVKGNAASPHGLAWLLDRAFNV